MASILQHLVFLIVFCCVIACANDKLEDVTTIQAQADCTGPKGNYSTETHSTIGGYTYLDQVYGDSGDRFRAVAYNDSLGFLLTDTSRTGLDAMQIYLIKSHDFPMISLFPLTFFDSSCVSGCDTLFTLDPLDNQAVLYYDQANRLSGFKLSNPFVVNQFIHVNYSNFELKKGIEVPKKVRIIQGINDTFYFNYTEIEFNPEDFEMYEIN